jgi:hypothetical protein
VPRESQINNIGYESTAHVLKAIPAEREAIGASVFPPLEGIPDVLRENPESRKVWLLSKALENLPLDKALELAEIAERFLSGVPSESRGTTGIFARLNAGSPTALAATGETPAAVSNGIGTDHGWQSADTMKLTVLASIDDITRYLGQHGELITSKGSLFVVNGQSEVTRNELLDYANRVRVRQDLPTYALLPTPPVVADTEAKRRSANLLEPRPPKPPQPPSRKEREHWAQQVTAL